VLLRRKTKPLPCPTSTKYNHNSNDSENHHDLHSREYLSERQSPARPQLNGKVERSHRTDQEEFYQLLTYTDDVDLNKKLEEWERFYNTGRPHGAHEGKTPYEALRYLLELG
jgi:transposase InsO family protein